MRPVWYKFNLTGAVQKSRIPIHRRLQESLPYRSTFGFLTFALSVLGPSSASYRHRLAAAKVEKIRAIRVLWKSPDLFGIPHIPDLIHLAHTEPVRAQRLIRGMQQLIRQYTVRFGVNKILGIRSPSSVLHNVLLTMFL